MPYAEKGQSLKGQAYGQAKAQQDFQAATEAAPQAESPVTFGAQPPAYEGNIMDAILGPTMRPDEPVTAGLDRLQDEDLQAARSWFPLIKDLATDPNASPAVRDLYIRAQLVLGE